MLKNTLILLVFFLASCATQQNGIVKKEDSDLLNSLINRPHYEVTEALGPPDSKMENGDGWIWFYDFDVVRPGVVTSYGAYRPSTTQVKRYMVYIDEFGFMTSWKVRMASETVNSGETVIVR
jgi:outer membrane protein assembly factor BamE (lipoprotein component of BamABCDE complex)